MKRRSSDPARKSGQRESGQRKSGQRESGQRKSGQRESGQRESGQRKSSQRESCRWVSFWQVFVVKGSDKRDRWGQMRDFMRQPMGRQIRLRSDL